MKFLGKLIIVLLIILLLILLSVFILLQTTWGATQLSQWISQKSDYQFSFDKLSYDWSSPAHLTLNNVSLAKKGSPPTLVAQAVSIGLSARQFSQPSHLGSITLKQGTLNLNASSAALPLQADTLRLNDMVLNSSDANWNLRAQRVNGGVAPWHPEQGNLLSRGGTIQFSAGSMVLNGVPASNVLIQGRVDDKQISLTNLGADIARGSLTGSATRNSDGSWQIERLRLSDIRLQTEKSISAFLAPITHLPSVKIDNLDITNARLEGKNWAVTDLNMNLDGLTVSGNSWQSDDGRLSMNASEFIHGELDLRDPIFNADFSPRGMTLRQFTSRWEGGIVRATGQWLRDDNHLALDEVVVAGLEYTLPKNWKSLWTKTLPDWLTDVSVKKLTFNRNLIIDIDPSFPFQLTALDGQAKDLLLAQNRHWGIWGGNLNLNASAATFNRVDVRRPSIALMSSANQITITELSAFAGKGILEATATIGQDNQREVKLTLNGRSVPINILQQWGWPGLPLEGEGNIDLSATGQLAAPTPLKTTVNATLQATSADGKQIQQRMQNGAVPGA